MNRFLDRDATLRNGCLAVIILWFSGLLMIVVTLAILVLAMRWALGL